ncbi:MAG: protein translocase subunit SecF [Halobacteriaceae archaeon]
MVAFEVPEIDYTRYSNRQLAAVPLAVLGLALLVLVAWYAMTGAPVGLGIEFTGGTELVVTETAQSPDSFDAAFSAEISASRPIQTQEGTYILTFQSTNTETLRSQARSAGYVVESYTGTNPTFGQAAQRTALQGVLIAFLGMSVVVFLLFRSLVPSVAVVVSAFSDIVIPVALMNVFGIKLSLGTVAALLMLIGYSVDSDILLNNHVLRRSGGFYESAARAMRTGVTMTVTSIAAMAVMSVVAYLFGIGLLSSIGIVLVFGLTADLMNTYMLNYSLLRWYKYEGVAR